MCSRNIYLNISNVYTGMCHSVHGGDHNSHTPTRPVQYPILPYSLRTIPPGTTLLGAKKRGTHPTGILICSCWFLGWWVDVDCAVYIALQVRQWYSIFPVHPAETSVISSYASNFWYSQISHPLPVGNLWISEPSFIPKHSKVAWYKIKLYICNTVFKLVVLVISYLCFKKYFST